MMSNLWQALTTPFQFPFMQHALLAAIVVGVVCAVLSCFLVLKGWSLMGDAVSHAVLPGIAIAQIVGFSHAIGAFMSGIFAAIFTGFIRENSRLNEDTVMGIVFSGMFALGILMVTQIETDQHLMHIIRGNLLGISDAELIETVIICGIVFVTIGLKWKDFMLYCFDIAHARVVGLPVKTIHYTLLTLLALTIVASIQAVGVIMVVALLIAPGMTGYLLTKSFPKLLAIAVAVAIISAFIGTITSFYWDASTAACIVLVQSSLVVIALIFQSLRRFFQKSDPLLAADKG